MRKRDLPAFIEATPHIYVGFADFLYMILCGTNNYTLPKAREYELVVVIFHFVPVKTWVENYIHKIRDEKVKYTCVIIKNTTTWAHRLYHTSS